MARNIFQASLEKLHNDLIRMGSIVEKQVYLSIEALKKKDVKLSRSIIEDDEIVDNMQKEIEDTCIKLIATQQPIATDLRIIFTTIKIVTDLERIADHAVDIAKITIRLTEEDYIKELIDIPKMAEIIKIMIKESIDSYVERDIHKAYEVCKKDDEVDDIYNNVFTELLIMMSENKSTIKQAAQFLFICKYLERIADHVTNICEWTIYLVTGEQVDLNE